MGFSQRKIFFTALFISIILMGSLQSMEAARPLDEETWLKNLDGLLLQFLPKGGKPPSPNPCTHIPGQSTGRAMKREQDQQYWIASLPMGPVSPSGPSGGTHVPSDINQRTFAGHAAPVSRVPPTALAVN